MNSVVNAGLTFGRAEGFPPGKCRVHGALKRVPGRLAPAEK